MTHGEEDNMEILNELKEKAGLGGAESKLANDLLVYHQQYEDGELTKEEYEFLVNQVAEITAAQELADDEVACRWVVAAAKGLMAVL